MGILADDKLSGRDGMRASVPPATLLPPLLNR